MEFHIETDSLKIIKDWTWSKSRFFVIGKEDPQKNEFKCFTVFNWLPWFSYWWSSRSVFWEIYVWLIIFSDTQSLRSFRGIINESDIESNHGDGDEKDEPFTNDHDSDKEIFSEATSSMQPQGEIDNTCPDQKPSTSTPEVSFLLTGSTSAKSSEELGGDMDKRTFASCSWWCLVSRKNIDFFPKWPISWLSADHHQLY